MSDIEAYGLTDVGKKRKHNEDAYALDEAEGLFIVADGMGGHAAGEVAAKITVETIGEFIAATRQKEEATWPFKYNHELLFNSNRLAIAIEKANERVMSAVAAQPWLKGMGTTVVAGLLNEKILSLAHVGDSRAYLYRNGRAVAADRRSFLGPRAGLCRDPDRGGGEDPSAEERRHAGARRRRLGRSGPSRNGVPPGRRVPPLLRRADDDALGRGDPRLRRRRREEGRRGALPGSGRPRQREGRRRQHHRRRRADSRSGRQGLEGRQSQEVVASAHSRRDARVSGSVNELTGPRAGGYPHEMLRTWSSGLLFAGLLLAVAPGSSAEAATPAAAPDGAFVEEAVGAYLGRREAAEVSTLEVLAAAGLLDFRAHPRELGRLWVQEVVLGSGESGLKRRALEEAASVGETPKGALSRLVTEAARTDARALLRAAARLYATVWTEASPSRLRLFDLETGALDAAPPAPLSVRHRSFVSDGETDALRLTWPSDGGDGAAVVRYADASLPPDVVFFAAGDRRAIPLSGVARIDFLVAGSELGIVGLKAPVEITRESRFAVLAPGGSRRGRHERASSHLVDGVARGASRLGHLPRGDRSRRTDPARRTRGRALLRVFLRALRVRVRRYVRRGGDVLSVHRLGGDGGRSPDARVRGHSRNRPGRSAESPPRLK